MKRRFFTVLFSLMLILITTVGASALNVAGVEGPDIPTMPTETDPTVYTTIEEIEDAISEAQINLTEAQNARTFWQAEYLKALTNNE